MTQDQYNRLLGYYDQEFAEIKQRLDSIDVELRNLGRTADVDGVNGRLDQVLGHLEDVIAGQDALMVSHRSEGQ